jgi:hypothetical protein
MPSSQRVFWSFVPKPLLGNRVTEQAHLLGLVADVVGHPVVGHDLQLAGHHGGADELTRRIEDVPEVGIRDCGVCHASIS